MEAVATSVEERQKNLLLFVDHLMDVHDGWIKSDFEYLPQSFEEAADGLVDIFAGGLIPAECRALAERVAEFGREWEAWKAGAATSGEGCPQSNGFWRSLDNVRDARRRATPDSGPPPVESIADLERQKVGDAQICAIYGWGTLAKPELTKLAEERAKPGRHTGKDFVGPAKQEWERAQRDQAERVAKVRQERTEKIGKSVVGESLPELLAQGVSARQIGLNLGKTVEEVHAECDRLALPRPTEDYKDTRYPTVPKDPEQVTESGVSLRLHPEAAGGAASALTLEQQIVELHQQGNNSREIAEVLSTPEEPVSWQKAGAIIRRFKEQPEAFASPGG